jgi:hypothetical protein
MGFEAFSKVHPSHTEPKLILSYTQASGAFNLLPQRAPKVQIGSEDLVVYAHKLDMRSDARVNQSATNLLPSPSFKTELISTPTYLVRNRAEYDHHDVANASNWNVSLPEAYRKANRQGFFQFARRALLDGVIPSNGEGFLNAAGATSVNFPNDPSGASTLVTMDPDWVFRTINDQIIQLKTRIMNIGIPGILRVVVLAPQRVISRFQSTIIEVTSFQREGAGSHCRWFGRSDGMERC